MSRSTGPGRFVIAVHDVAPVFRSELEVIVRALGGLVGPTVSLAVVPCWHGRWPLTAHPHFAGWLAERGGERLLHGYEHRSPNPRRPRSRVVGGADEFVGLSAAAAEERVHRGQALFRRVFGDEAAGFVAPAWQMGSLHAPRLASAGIRFVVELAGLTTVDGTRRSLASWSWDVGWLASRSRLGELAGSLLALRRDAIPCVTVHPADVRRGHLPHALARIRRLLEAGRQPTLFGEIA